MHKKVSDHKNKELHTQRTSQPVLLKATELAKILQVSKRTLWRLLSSGQLIKPIKIGGNTRWRQQEVQDWIKEGCPLPKAHLENNRS